MTDTPSLPPAVLAQQIEHVPIDRLRPHPRNPNVGDVDAIVESMRENDVLEPIVVQRSTGYVISGNHRLQALQRVGHTSAPVVYVDVDDERALRYLLAANRTRDLASYDDPTLAELLADLSASDAGLSGTGYDQTDLDALLDSLLDEPPVRDDPPEPDDPDDDVPPSDPAVSLSDRFGVVPFTVLSSRDAWWQQRKRSWLALGIRSETGRDDVTMASLPARAPDYYQQKNDAEAKVGRSLSNAEFERDHFVYTRGANISGTSGASVFDPVLCEIAYRWFAPPGGTVLDPFAGGSVRGIVASRLGLAYTGIELRAEQVQANRDQARAIVRPDDPTPIWVVGDSAEVLDSADLDDSYDLVFSCPPYADLEVYSDDPADLSTMPYDQFLDQYRTIIAKAVDRLADNRYAVWVVGEARGRDGNYYGLVPDTIRAFQDAGCSLYNEAVLVTPVGALPIRIGRQFATSRKMGKTHQNVLVFVKGDGRAASDACGTVNLADDEADVDLTGDRLRGTITDPAEVTPVEMIDDVYVKRDDAYGLDGSCGGKARVAMSLVAAATTGGVVTAGARHSPQVTIVARAAARAGIPCRVHVPKGSLTEEALAAQAAGAEVVVADGTFTAVAERRSRDDAAASDWYEVPFGMECQEAVDAAARQTSNLPADARRVVIPVGSGMSLAGVLTGLAAAGRDLPVLGVVVGADPTERLDRWAPPDWRDRATLVPAQVPYGTRIEARWGDVALDPVYEAKCLPFLQDGDVLWIVGHR